MKINFFHRYLSVKVLPIWTILLVDLLTIIISTLLSYALRYDFRSIFIDSSTLDATLIWTVLINLIFFRVFRTYSNVLRFSSIVDIMTGSRNINLRHTILFRIILGSLV